MSFNAPEPTHVRNVAPKGRDVNKPQNRDAVEKERLKERRFGYNRYQPEVVDKPFVTLTKAAGFIPDAERFHTDVAGEDKRRRDDRAAAAKALTEAKRAARIVGEEERWSAFEKSQEEEIKRWDNIRADEKNPMARRNNLSVPYNPVTLQYNDSLDGLRMQYSDNMTKYRGEVRSLMLFTKGNGPVNPITGDPLGHVPQPKLPAKNFQDRSDAHHTNMFH